MSTALAETSSHPAGRSGVVPPILNGPINKDRRRYTSLDHVLKVCRDMVIRYRGDRRIRGKALEITAGIPADRTGNPDRRNFDAIADAVYRWIITNIEYVRDPYLIEWLQTPDVTISEAAGDCDDMVVLSAALLGSLGINTSFKVVGKKPGSFEHIYVIYQNRDGRWIAFDPTLGSSVGDEPNPENYKEVKIVPLDDRATRSYSQKGRDGSLSDSSSQPARVNSKKTTGSASASSGHLGDGNLGFWGAAITGVASIGSGFLNWRSSGEQADAAKEQARAQKQIAEANVLASQQQTQQAIIISGAVLGAVLIGGTIYMRAN